MWHIAQETVLLADKRRSKKSLRPSATFSAETGLSSGIGIAGNPSGGADNTASRSASLPSRDCKLAELVL
jgi:hypothetical protein